MPRSSIHRVPSIPCAALVAALFIALGFSANLSAQEGAKPARTVNLAVVYGDVQVQNPGESTRVKAVVNTPMQQGAILYTGMGMAEIYFEDGATGYLGQDSILEFTELDSGNAGRITRLTLTQGDSRFFANTRDVNVFSIKTPTLTVSPHPLVDFHLRVHPTGSVVDVSRGEASVEDDKGQTLVAGSGQAVTMAAGATQATLGVAPPSDAFDTWFPVLPYYQPYSAFPIGPPPTLTSPPSTPVYYPPPYPVLPRPSVQRSGPPNPR
jgi:hypothetical protein